MSAVEREKGDRQLESLVCRFQGDLWRYLRFLGAESSEADDLVQETFLGILRSEFQYRSDPEAFIYLRTAARRQWLMANRRRGRELNTVELDAAESAWVEIQTQVGGWGEYLAALGECLSELRGKARQGVELYYRQGYDQTEVGQQLGMQREGVKTLLRRVRQQLRKCIERKVIS